MSGLIVFDPFIGYRVSESDRGTFRVYEMSKTLDIESIRIALKLELERYARLRGLHNVISALIRMKAICFQVWTLESSVVAAYRIIVDNDQLYFASPKELLRKLDELGFFDVGG